MYWYSTLSHWKWQLQARPAPIVSFWAKQCATQDSFVYLLSSYRLVINPGFEPLTKKIEKNESVHLVSIRFDCGKFRFDPIRFFGIAQPYLLLWRSLPRLPRYGKKAKTNQWKPAAKDWAANFSGNFNYFHSLQQINFN